MQKRTVVWLFIFIFLILIINYVVRTYYLGNKKFRLGEDSPAPSSPMKMNLFISQPPVMGETAEIVAVIRWIPTNIPPMEDTTAQIILPDGFELLEGDLKWEGELQKEVNFSITIRAIKVGNWTIEGLARSPPTGETFSGGRDFIYISVGKHNSFIQEWSFPEPWSCPNGENCAIAGRFSR